MAYSGAVQVIPFQSPDAFTSVATSLIDVSASSADVAVLIVPVPLEVYAFGIYVTESFAAAGTGSIFLERATNVVGTDTTVSELDFDAVALKSGDGNKPLQTASTGSEDIDLGDVVYAPSSAFPVLIAAPQVLTVRFVQTAIVGEAVPFIVARWQGMDLRPTSVWAS
jgi:hypothetical protein